MIRKIGTGLIVLLVPVVFAAPAFAFSPADIFSSNWFQNIVKRVEQKTDGKVTEQQIKKRVVKGLVKRKVAKNIGENMWLDKLVADGKITTAQKAAILAEIEQLKAKYSVEAMKSLTPAERQQKMKEMQAEIQAFAKTQGVSMEQIMPFGMMRPKMTGEGAMRKIMASPTPTQ